MKYIKESEGEKILISDYLKELELKTKESHILQDEYDFIRGKHLLEIFKDIKIEKELIKELISQYSRIGGRYSVRADDETLKELLDFSKEYPFLTTKAISELANYYIEDIFQEYSLKEIYKDFIKTYYKTDESFENYIEYIDKLEEKIQKEYIEEAKEIELLKEEYGKRLVYYLKTIIKSKHIHKDKILKCLPEANLIQKDEDQLLEFATKSRIYLGICHPKSYELIMEMTKDEELSTYPENFKYKSSFGDEIPLTFTKTEFIESTKKK